MQQLKTEKNNFFSANLPFLWNKYCIAAILSSGILFAVGKWKLVFSPLNRDATFPPSLPPHLENN